ncbi:hypothetical protein ABEB36_008737 [Hypothenemus hampei]|uniref:C-type lectin domain-containing protein n=1 Tax=Hypothenemus hampei TaxID=57062 RepID=A0ABD1EQU3_HYPHA
MVVHFVSKCNTGLTGSSMKYFVSMDKQTFIQALINCKSAGMNLASIRSQEEQKNLEIFLKRNGYNDKDGYWLSGMNLGNGTYFWASSGDPLTYKKWLPNQPENTRPEISTSRRENCIQLVFNNKSSQEFGWNNLFCKRKLLYICQVIM